MWNCPVMTHDQAAPRSGGDLSGSGHVVLLVRLVTLPVCLAPLTRAKDLRELNWLKRVGEIPQLSRQKQARDNPQSGRAE